MALAAADGTAMSPLKGVRLLASPAVPRPLPIRPAEQAPGYEQVDRFAGTRYANEHITHLAFEHQAAVKHDISLAEFDHIPPGGFVEMGVDPLTDDALDGCVVASTVSICWPLIVN